jgi:hypothetical protein
MDSAVGIAVGYGAGRPRSLVRVPVWSRIFSTPFILAVGPPIEWVPGCLADHSPLTGARAKNILIYASTPPVRIHGVVLS